MHVSENGLHLIEEFEGYSGVQYRDSVGVPTIGFGTTAADVSPLPWTCSRAQAEGWLRSNVARKYEPAVNGTGVPLNQNQFDALMSLAYNVGPGVMGWQIGVDLRRRNYVAASADFMHYVFAGGRVLQGLVNRRRAEQQLFNSRPAPIPPVNPYAKFPTDIGDRSYPNKGNERLTIQQAYGALANVAKHKAYLKDVVWGELKRYRDRCWTIAVFMPPTYKKKRPRALWDDPRLLGARWQEHNKVMERIAALR